MSKNRFVIFWTFLTVFGTQPALADDIGVFVQTYRCDVIEALEAIAKPFEPPSNDRYTVISRVDRPQAYVQCLALPNDTMLCEASTGAYGPKAGEPGAFALTSEMRTELKVLGFEEDSNEKPGNASYTVITPTPLSRGIVAEKLLTTLYKVYGARLTTKMLIAAPLRHKKPILLGRCRLLS